MIKKQVGVIHPTTSNLHFIRYPSHLIPTPGDCLNIPYKSHHPSPQVTAMIKKQVGVIQEENFSMKVPILKSHHRYIIGKGGINIKK